MLLSESDEENEEMPAAISTGPIKVERKYAPLAPFTVCLTFFLVSFSCYSLSCLIYLILLTKFTDRIEGLKDCKGEQ